MSMFARNVEINLRSLFFIGTKNRNARHAAQKNRQERCLPSVFLWDINSNRLHQAPVHHARAVVHPTVRTVLKYIPQVAIH